MLQTHPSCLHRHKWNVRKNSKMRTKRKKISRRKFSQLIVLIVYDITMTIDHQSSEHWSSPLGFQLISTEYQSSWKEKFQIFGTRQVWIEEIWNAFKLNFLNIPKFHPVHQMAQQNKKKVERKSNDHERY